MNYKIIITNTLLKYHVFYKKFKTTKAMQMYTPLIHLFCFSIVCVLRILSGASIFVSGAPMWKEVGKLNFHQK